MKHTIKLLTLAAILTAVFGLTGCPGPVNNYIEPEYTITVKDDVENGVVETDKTLAKVGETVTLTITPNSSYELESITVNAVALSGEGNTRTFTMPAENVVINVTFKVIEAVHEHVFGDWSAWKVVTAATCTENGSKKRTRTCSCGEVEEETAVIAALGHDWEEIITDKTKAATCTENGLAVYKCKTCGAIEKRTTNKLGHNFGEWSIVTPATCTTNGSKRRVCSRCGHEETETIPAHHTFIAGGCDKCGEYQYADGIKFHLYVTTQEKYDETYGNNTNTIKTIRRYSNTRSNDIWDDYYLSFENENSLPNGVFYYDVEEEEVVVNMIRLLGLKNLNHNSFTYGVAENIIVYNSTYHIGISFTLENNFYIVLN